MLVHPPEDSLDYIQNSKDRIDLEFSRYLRNRQKRTMNNVKMKKKGVSGGKMRSFGSYSTLKPEKKLADQLSEGDNTSSLILGIVDKARHASNKSIVRMNEKNRKAKEYVRTARKNKRRSGTGSVVDFLSPQKPLYSQT
jgi:hypothetical protein